MDQSRICQYPINKVSNNPDAGLVFLIGASSTVYNILESFESGPFQTYSKCELYKHLQMYSC